MKAEKRHELEKNELADWMGEQIEAAKPYAPTIAIVLIGGALAVLLASYLIGSGGTASARAWSTYFTAFNEREPEVPLEAFVKELPDTPASLWAEQAVGDINLRRGSMSLFSDREEAKKLIEKAETALLHVEKEAKDPMLRTRNKLSLATLYETKCQPEQARKYYEEVAKTEKDSAIGKLAQKSAERLADPAAVEMLAWFAEQKPRRPAAGMGSGGLPGLPNDLPERPDLSLPGLGAGPFEPGAGLNLDNLDTDNAAESKLEFPKPGEPKPGETKAEADKPAEPPAPEGKPAEPKPGESPPPESPTPESPAETKPQ